MDNNIIKEILEKIQDVRIAIYGDFCLDAYWIMDPAGSEISVETGLQAESVAVQKYSPGGAGNVFANVAALKPKLLKAIGVIGNDIHGRELTRQIQQLGGDTSGFIIQEENFETYTYTKRILEGNEQPRIDFGLLNKRTVETDNKIVKNIRQALENYDVLIFNQQVEGSLTNSSFIEGVNQLFEEFDDKIVILDSRHYNNKFKNICRKINEVEAGVLLGKELKPRDFIPFSDIKKYGTEIYNQYHKPVFVSCGSRGILTFDNEGVSEVPGLQILKRIDTVGAGDTTISALALCLAAGIKPADAAVFANFASGVTIQKLYTTGTASGDEILEISKDADYNYRPELAEDIRQAEFIPETEFEICNKAMLSNLGNIKHAIFDHDGTISTLRQGWEKIMEPVMIKAILGEKFNTADKALYDNVRKRVLNFIDVSTGIQTIVQMEGLVQLVDEFDIVPKDKILDKFAYKEIYNDALMVMVNKRIEKLKKGELSIEDYAVKGAVDFLKALKAKGVKLYLASGTDKEDVINEAKVMRYVGLFEGEIHGAVGDINKYSKKMVIEKIISENKLKGNELMVTGDGPVEIKECHKVKGIAIGIASDEIRRYGLNEEKRTRLIKAGADIVINDFSQAAALTKILFNE
ncbi:MAG: PfkB family carbohydrate kinase [Bacteroidota bacterium]